MPNRTIKVGSITYAMKARKALSNISISAKISKITAVNGCEYSIQFPASEYYSVIAELKKHNIKYEVIG
ncbi:MAG: DUF3343 domain-containing protein [Clostridia bacterium]|nr:DUF3343 domain-containing protein [Clostridia bacterium]MBQ5800348.1 DUF3343 domain-containing protein [Clostridia bacterium]